jgi:hypothetical protein
MNTKLLNITNINVLIFLVIFIIYVFSGCKIRESKVDLENLYNESWKIYEYNFLQDTINAQKKFRELLSKGYMPLNGLFIEGLKAEATLDPNFDLGTILASSAGEKVERICNSKSFIKFAFCDTFLYADPSNVALQIEILIMLTADQQVRNNKINILSEEHFHKVKELVELGLYKVDSLNVVNLKRIIEHNGFPRLEQVGVDAMRGVFIIIQHADRFPEWQKSQLGNIKKAADLREIDPEKFAYLYDRICINSGKKQLYGTQFKKVDYSKGIATIQDTENLSGLSKRRMELEMMPLPMYKRLMLVVAERH